MKNLKEPIDCGKGQPERYEGETTFPSDLVTFGPVRGHVEVTEVTGVKATPCPLPRRLSVIPSVYPTGICDPSLPK